MFKIGELARATGLAPSKIRFYEARGLIGAVDRTPGGYRQYPVRTKQMLELVSLAQQAGFSLAEIQALMPPAGKPGIGQDAVLARLRAKLAEIETLQSKLAATHAGLLQVIEQIANATPDNNCSEDTEKVLESFRAMAPPA